MKNVIIAAFFGTLFLASCSSENRSTDNQNADSVNIQNAGVVYTCPMHPEVVSDQPGKCPKCGMNLVEKGSTADTSNMDSMHNNH